MPCWSAIRSRAKWPPRASRGYPRKRTLGACPTSDLLQYLEWVLVISQRDKPRVPQMILWGPLSELELPHKLRLQPATILHLRRGEPLSPTPASDLRQIREWALYRLDLTESLEQLSRSEGVNPLRVRATYISLSPS
jgi:hypothetical protein